MRALLQPIRTKQKATAVAAAVKCLAKKMGPGQKLPTVKELCTSLNVAIGTLDSALDNLERQGAIECRHGDGIYVSPQIHQKTIGLVFGANVNVFGVGASPFPLMIIQCCRQRAKSHHEKFSFFLNLQSTDAEGIKAPGHHDLTDAIRLGKLHGILLVAHDNEEEAQWLCSQNLPVVTLNDERHPHNVLIDYEKLVRLGVEALAAKGCRRIGLVTPFESRPFKDDPLSRNVLRGFSEALKRLGLSQRPEWIWEHRVRIDGAQETHGEWGYQAVDEMFAEGRWEYPDGLVFADDLMTRGALAAMWKRGLMVGSDLEIATHANKGSPVLRGYEDELTLIEVDSDKVVAAMFGMLEVLMEGRKPLPSQTILVQPRVVVSNRVMNKINKRFVR